MNRKKAGKRARAKRSTKNAAGVGGKPAAAKRTFDDLLAGASANAARVARQLREIVQSVLPGYDENIYGGAKVSIALYSKGGPNRVLCGIQTSGQHCLLYVHHAFELSHPAITFDGKGKHARHIRYASAAEVKKEPLAWLLRRAQAKSTFN